MGHRAELASKAANNEASAAPASTHWQTAMALMREGEAMTISKRDRWMAMHMLLDCEVQTAERQHADLEEIREGCRQSLKALEIERRRMHEMIDAVYYTQMEENKRLMEKLEPVLTRGEETIGVFKSMQKEMDDAKFWGGSQ